MEKVLLKIPRALLGAIFISYVWTFNGERPLLKSIIAGILLAWAAASLVFIAKERLVAATLLLSVLVLLVYGVTHLFKHFMLDKAGEG